MNAFGLIFVALTIGLVGFLIGTFVEFRRMIGLVRQANDLMEDHRKLHLECVTEAAKIKQKYDELLKEKANQ